MARSPRQAQPNGGRWGALCATPWQARLDEDELKEALRVHRVANRAKHSWPAPPTAPSPSAATGGGAGWPCPRGAWADAWSDGGSSGGPKSLQSGDNGHVM